MDSDFDIVLDGLRGMVSNFDFNNFTSKDIVPYKAQHMCRLDWVSSLVRLGTRTFTVGHASLNSASSKETKHEKTCYNN